MHMLFITTVLFVCGFNLNCFFDAHCCRERGEQPASSQAIVLHMNTVVPTAVWPYTILNVHCSTCCAADRSSLHSVRSCTFEHTLLRYHTTYSLWATEMDGDARGSQLSCCSQSSMTPCSLNNFQQFVVCHCGRSQHQRCASGSGTLLVIRRCDPSIV